MVKNYYYNSLQNFKGGLIYEKAYCKKNMSKKGGKRRWQVMKFQEEVLSKVLLPVR